MLASSNLSALIMNETVSHGNYSKEDANRTVACLYFSCSSWTQNREDQPARLPAILSLTSLECHHI